MQTKNTVKKTVNIIFTAMAVLTVAMIVATVVNSARRKQAFKIPADIELVQLDTLNGNIADDAMITVVSTDLGEFAAELYPQFAPETVANYKALSESGYYDGTFIYEVEKGVHLGGGCVYNDGSLPDGYDKKSEMIGPEISKNLWPIKGAVMSCGLTHSTLWDGQEIFSGSRFLISGTIDFTDEEKEQMRTAQGSTNIADMFIKYGGTPNVSQKITVFAQIFDGWDVLDVLLNAEADESTRRPVHDIEILNTRILTYSEYKNYKENKEKTESQEN